MCVCLYKLEASFQLNICCQIFYADYCNFQASEIKQLFMKIDTKSKHFITNSLHQEFNNIYIHIYIHIYIADNDILNESLFSAIICKKCQRIAHSVPNVNFPSVRLVC